MADFAFEALEYLSRNATASLLALLALQGADSDSTAATTILINWHLGEADTPGDPWDSVHRPESYQAAEPNQLLTTQNNAARSLISHLIGANAVVAAWRTFELIEPSARYEAPNETAATWYMAAAIAEHERDLKAETKWRREAEVVWFRAESTGAPFSAGDRLMNRQALDLCHQRASTKSGIGQLTVTEVAAVVPQQPTSVAADFGIPVYYQGVLPADTSSKPTANTL